MTDGGRLEAHKIHHLRNVSLVVLSICERALVHFGPATSCGRTFRTRF